MLQSKKIKTKASTFVLFFKVLILILVSQTSIVDIHILLYVAILTRLVACMFQLIKFIYNWQFCNKYKTIFITLCLVMKRKKNIFLIFLPLILF